MKPRPREKFNLSEKDQHWKDLKAEWAHLKRGSNATEVEKGAAKERINAIQEKLGLEKTRWDQPRQGGSHLQGGGTDTTSANPMLAKILGTVLEIRRELGELTSDVNRMKAGEEKPLA
tara:strand:+ start:9759 stop:10112 length:354 start_codon:yes stop_codon:yes gene_type:complete